MAIDLNSITEKHNKLHPKQEYKLMWARVTIELIERMRVSYCQRRVQHLRAEDGFNS